MTILIMLHYKIDPFWSEVHYWRVENLEGDLQAEKHGQDWPSWESWLYVNIASWLICVDLCVYCCGSNADLLSPSFADWDWYSWREYCFLLEWIGSMSPWLEVKQTCIWLGNSDTMIGSACFVLESCISHSDTDIELSSEVSVWLPQTAMSKSKT